ncbi:MAG: Fic family protein [Deltaproteobacteria bacterium]
MDLTELKNIIASGESEIVEFKRSTSQHIEAAKTICAVSVAMYDDHLEIANPGALHFGITPEKLLKPHESRPWNPIIASVFYRSGIIEQWGSGTLKIIDLCKEGKAPVPKWSEQAGSVLATFKPSTKFKATPQVTGEVGRLLPLCVAPKNRKELLDLLGLKDREHFRKVYLVPALENGYIERTIPDKPQSSKQKYRLTEKGKRWLEEISSVKEAV